jgi:modulator of FtsH protease
MNDRGVRTSPWGEGYAAPTTATRLGFLKKVYGLFTASILFSAIGAMLALNLGVGTSQLTVSAGNGRVVVPPLVGFFAQHPFISIIVMLASVFGASFVRHKRGLNIIALFGMATILGIVIGPALFFAQLSAGLGGTLSSSPIRDAFILATLGFAGLTGYALITKKDFSYLGGALMMGLFVVIGASLLNLFLGSSVFGLALASVSVLLFGAYVLYDTSRIMRSGENDVVGAAIQLFLNFFNIFLAILRILSSRRE